VATWRVSGACLAVVVGGLTLAGCGSGGPAHSAAKPTVASLVKTVQSDFRHASSVRLSGHIREHGQRLAADLKMLRSGDAAGQISLGEATMRIVRVGTKTYVHVTKAFFRYLVSTRHVPSSACALICGKYVTLPQGAVPQLSLANLARRVDKNMSVPKARTHVSVTTFAGRPAYEVSTTGKAAFFAKNGHHYLIGLRDQKQGMAISFSEWNSVRPISPPPASKIVGLG
jgi:hypothetical protein